jgi:hypothetical protein
MVLLKSILSDEKGRYAGRTEEGKDVRIIGVPNPKALAVYLEEQIDVELEKLEELARADGSKYYLIQNKDEVLKGWSNTPRIFAIGYTEFRI